MTPPLRKATPPEVLEFLWDGGEKTATCGLWAGGRRDVDLPSPLEVDSPVFRVAATPGSGGRPRAASSCRATLQGRRSLGPRRSSWPCQRRLGPWQEAEGARRGSDSGHCLSTWAALSHEDECVPAAGGCWACSRERDKEGKAPRRG